MKSMCRQWLPRVMPRYHVLALGSEAHFSTLRPIVAANPLDILQVAVDAVVDGGVPVADGGCREHAVVRQAASRGCEFALTGVAHQALRQSHTFKIQSEFCHDMLLCPALTVFAHKALQNSNLWKHNLHAPIIKWWLYQALHMSP